MPGRSPHAAAPPSPGGAATRTASGGSVPGPVAIVVSVGFFLVVFVVLVLVPVILVVFVVFVSVLSLVIVLGLNLVRFAQGQRFGTRLRRNLGCGFDRVPNGLDGFLGGRHRLSPVSLQRRQLAIVHISLRSQRPDDARMTAGDRRLTP